MITKINARNHATPVFRAHLLRPQTISSVSIAKSYKSSQKINSIKSVCEDIFASIKLDKNILAKANSLLDKAKLSENSITFLNGNNSAIRFSNNVSGNNKIFIMELLEKNTPKASIILDSFGKLIKPQNSEKLEYYTPEEINFDSLDKVIETIFNATDDSLFKMRMFLRKNCEQAPEIKQDLEIEAIPEIVNSIITSPEKIGEERIYLEEKLDIIRKMPITGIKHNYSYREVIKQNQAKEAKLKEKGFISKEDVVEPLKVFDRKEKKLKKTTTTKNVLKEKSTKKPKISNKPKLKNNPPLTKIKIKPFSVVPKEIFPKRRSGRPKKVMTEDSLVEIKPKKKRGRPVGTKKSLLPAGKIDFETSTKMQKIFDLYNQVNSFVKKVTSSTRVIIYSAYEGLKVRKNGFSFNNIDLVFFKRASWDNMKCLSILDNSKKESINIFENGTILPLKTNLFKLNKIDSLQFSTQEEIDNENQKNIMNQLLDKSIDLLENYKLFLERKGWRSVDRRLASDEEGKVDAEVLKKLRKVTDKYVNLKARLTKIGSSKACCIKKDYGVLSIKTPRLEFINAFNDGYNLVINKLNSKYGDLTLVCRYDGGEILEDVFVISKDGKFIKNYNKNFGLNKVINHKSEKVQFINDDYIQQEQLSQKLDNILDLIEKKIDDCEIFIDNYQYIKPEKIAN